MTLINSIFEWRKALSHSRRHLPFDWKSIDSGAYGFDRTRTKWFDRMREYHYLFNYHIRLWGHFIPFFKAWPFRVASWVVPHIWVHKKRHSNERNGHIEHDFSLWRFLSHRIMGPFPRFMESCWCPAVIVKSVSPSQIGLLPSSNDEKCELINDLYRSANVIPNPVVLGAGSVEEKLYSNPMIIFSMGFPSFATSCHRQKINPMGINNSWPGGAADGKGRGDCRFSLLFLSNVVVVVVVARIAKV